jgi:hypothetical protein
MKNPACSAVKREAEEDSGADCSRRHVKCGLTQNFDIALTGFRKLDDRSGDHFVAEVASSQAQGRRQ